MSEEAYSLIAALTALAYAVVLWLRFRQQRILKRILASLTEEQREELRKALQQQGDSTPPAK